MEELPSRFGMNEEEYEKVAAAATAAYEHLGKALEKSIKRLVDEATGEMADYVATWMESDANSNFYSMVTDRTNRIIKGLLSGGYDEKTAKEWLAGYDFEYYRKNIYVQYKDIIHNKLVDELQAKNAELEKQLEMYRRMDC